MREVIDPQILSQLNAEQYAQPPQLRPVDDPRVLSQLNSPVPMPNSTAQSDDTSARAMRAFLNQTSPFTPKLNPEEESRYNLGEKIGTSLMDYAPYLMGGTGITKLGAKALSKFPATAKGIAEFTAKHPKFAKYIPEGLANAIGGAGYSAVNAPEDERLGSAIEGGLMGAGATVLGGGVIDPLLRYGASKYAQSVIPEFTKKATEKLGELVPSGFSKKLEDRFLKASEKNYKNWSDLEKSAYGIDESLISPIREKGFLVKSPNKKMINYVEDLEKMGAPLEKRIIEKSSGGKAAISGEYNSGGAPIYKEGINFDNSPYFNYVEGYKNKIKGLEPAKRVPYSQALDIAEKSAELAPESFSGAVATRKNINQAMKDYLSDNGKAINPANMESKKFLTGLKNTIKDDLISANKEKVNPEELKNFRNLWETANQSHQDLQKFYKSPQRMTGVEQEKGTTIKQALKASLPESMGGKNIPIDPAIISKYVPSLSPQGAQGVEGLKQLSKIMGSKKDAVEAAKAHIFRKPLENGANTVDVASTYAKLSPAQRKYMFGNSEEGKMLEAINKTRLTFGREPAKTADKLHFLHGVRNMGVAGLLGGGAALASGESWDKSLGIGLATAAASHGLGKLISKTGNVPRVNRAINFGKAGTTNSSRNINALSQILINQPPEQRR